MDPDSVAGGSLTRRSSRLLNRGCAGPRPLGSSCPADASGRRLSYSAPRYRGCLHGHPPTNPPAGHPRLTGGLLRGSIRVSSRRYPGRGRTEGFIFAWGYDINDARTFRRVGFVATFATVSCERDGCFGGFFDRDASPHPWQFRDSLRFC